MVHYWNERKGLNPVPATIETNITIPNTINSRIYNTNPNYPNIITNQARDWFSNTTTIYNTLDLSTITTTQCNHGDHQALRNYMAATTPRLTPYTNDSLLVYCKNNADTIPVLTVAQGPYGVPQEDADFMFSYMDNWNHSQFRPTLPTNNDNKRCLLRRPDTLDNNTLGLYNGGLWRPRNSQSRLPELTADLRSNTIPYTTYMDIYEKRGISTMVGCYRYILEPESYDTAINIYKALPRRLSNFISPDDGATTHIFNFNFYADCHKDCRNRGVTTQIKYGHDNTWLCFPTLNMRIQLRHGAIVSFKDNKLEHYVDSDPDTPDEPTLPRYLHTNHTPSTVISSYNTYRTEWDNLITLSVQDPATIFNTINAFHT